MVILGDVYVSFEKKILGGCRYLICKINIIYLYSVV